MSVNLAEKARASRIAATEYVAERKSNLIALHDFRAASRKPAHKTIFGFVSSRKGGVEQTVAA